MCVAIAVSLTQPRAAVGVVLIWVTLLGPLRSRKEALLPGVAVCVCRLVPLVLKVINDSDGDKSSCVLACIG